MKGYTPQFRELGTAEGDFHAAFTTTNQKTRGYVKRLLKDQPDNPHVTKFVSYFEASRKTLWERWKRVLPEHLRPIVTSVKDFHNGPNLGEGSSGSFEAFLMSIEAYSRKIRYRLDDLVAEVPKNSTVVVCRGQLAKCLDELTEAKHKMSFLA